MYRPAAKRPARPDGVSPRFNKENKLQKKNHGTMGTAERFPCSSGGSRKSDTQKNQLFLFTGDPKRGVSRRPIKPINRVIGTAKFNLNAAEKIEKTFIR